MAQIILVSLIAVEQCWQNPDCSVLRREYDMRKQRMWMWPNILRSLDAKEKNMIEEIYYRENIIDLTMGDRGMFLK